MRLGRIRGAADQLDIPLLEIVQPFLECMELGRADKSEILRIEEEHHILLAMKLIEREAFHGKPADNGASIEVWCRFSYENGHGMKVVFDE